MHGMQDGTRVHVRIARAIPCSPASCILHPTYLTLRCSRRPSWP